MKCGMYLLLLVCFLCTGNISGASEPARLELKCAPETAPYQDSAGICADPQSAIPSPVPESSLMLLLLLQSDSAGGNTARNSLSGGATREQTSGNKPVIYFFYGTGCPHCEEEKKFLDGVKAANPLVEIKAYEVWHNTENARMLALMLKQRGAHSSGVPVTFIGTQMFTGFTAQTKAALEKTLADNVSGGETASETAVAIPILGTLDARSSSLPVLTLLIAGMDSFNPCAFFVLLTLLGLLIHAQSRNKMLLIGGIFVFFSGFIYFIFMAAWLNLFLVMGNVAIITTVAGSVSVIIAAINIKDFFLFKQGLSLSIPDSAKPKLFDRMRRLLRSTSIVSIIIGTTVLAVMANFYELLCTAGFPMVFTRILTLNNLSPARYYLYLVLYNIVYVIPLFIIVLGFTFTLGKRQLSEWQGRVLKLVSGTMMLGLGIVLLVNPALLNSVRVSCLILVAALGGSLLVAAVTRKVNGV